MHGCAEVGRAAGRVNASPAAASRVAMLYNNMHLRAAAVQFIGIGRQIAFCVNHRNRLIFTEPQTGRQCRASTARRNNRTQRPFVAHIIIKQE
jgi:hypothetical protein